jgi:hypothetical protein
MCLLTNDKNDRLDLLSDREFHNKEKTQISEEKFHGRERKIGRGSLMVTVGLKVALTLTAAQ